MSPSTHIILKNGSTALDAAVHAVSLLEDDPLFNCGRGSVFTLRMMCVERR
jgi:L-asparaginase